MSIFKYRKKRVHIYANSSIVIDSKCYSLQQQIAMNTFTIPKKQDTSERGQQTPVQSMLIETTVIDLMEGQSPESQMEMDDDDKIQEIAIFRRESNQTKGKLKQDALSNFLNLEEEARRNSELVKQHQLKKSQSSNERKMYAQLKKQFQNHSYLPFHVLKRVKEDLTVFQSKEKIQYPKSTLQAESMNIRSTQRSKLVRAILLALQQLRFKVKNQNLSEFQQNALQEKTDLLSFSFKLAKQIQIIFFKKLYDRKTDKKKGESYLNQIKTVLMAFGDKNNLAFRRQIINRKRDLIKLANETEEQLKSQQTKAEEAIRLKQFLRQNSKIEEIQMAGVISEEEEQPVLQPLANSLQNIGSATDLNEQKKQNQEKMQKQRLQRERLQQMLGKTKAICKKTYCRVNQIWKKMQERVVKLKKELPSQFLNRLDMPIE